MSESLIDIISGIAIVGLIITVIKLYLEQRKAKKDLELSKEYLKTLSELVKSLESQQQLEKEKLQWDRLTGIGKTLGWLYEKTKESEES
jgi:hypothetical protein